MTPEQKTIVRNHLTMVSRSIEHNIVIMEEDRRCLAAQSVERDAGIDRERYKLAAFRAALDELDAVAERFDVDANWRGDGWGVLDGKPRTYPDDDWTHGSGRYGG